MNKDQIGQEKPLLVTSKDIFDQAVKNFRSEHKKNIIKPDLSGYTAIKLKDEDMIDHILQLLEVLKKEIDQ